MTRSLSLNWQLVLMEISMDVTGCSIVHPHWLWRKDAFFNTYVTGRWFGLLRDAIDCSAHKHGPNSCLAEAAHHVSSLTLPCTLRQRTHVFVLSLDCRDFGLEAKERSVCPITEELEVLKKLVAWLQDIELIGEVRGEGWGRLGQPWRFNSEHLLWGDRWKKKG